MAAYVQVSDISINEVVTCKSCQHYHRTFEMWWHGKEPRCTRSRVAMVDLISGKVSNHSHRNLNTCEDERLYDYDDHCTKAGKFWVPKNNTKENTFKVLQRQGNVK